MCLIITKFNKLEVAQEDIKCYKILFKSSVRQDLFYAPYQSFNYELGIIYHTNISVSYDCNTYVASFFRRMFYYLFDKFLDVKGVNQGFHSFANLKNAIEEKNIDIDHKRLVVCECIIPAGAKYYKGTYLCYKGYVSDSIKINKIICA
jgi:hypothetical protein